MRDRLVRCRHPNDVAKLDKQLAQEWSWLLGMRQGAAAAASNTNKQVRGGQGMGHETGTGR